MSRKLFKPKLSPDSKNPLSIFDLVGYARHIEPKWFEVTETYIKLASSPQFSNLTILHLSDFHASPKVSYSQIEASIQIGLENNPDIACLTGDFITFKLKDADRYSAILKKLTRQIPTFACVGNHDRVKVAHGERLFTHSHERRLHYDDTRGVGHLLERSGVNFLFNQVYHLQEFNLTVMGLGDYISGACLPKRAFAEVDDVDGKQTMIVLSHNPDSKEKLANFDWDLMLCGHTHGGQLKTPLFGYRPLLWVAVKDRRFAEGLHSWKNRQIYITRGVGNILGFRFNCRPEISLLHIEPRTSKTYS